MLVQNEIKLSHKLVLGGVRVVALFIPMSRFNKTESAVLKLCRFSLFLKDPLFSVILLSY